MPRPRNSSPTLSLPQVIARRIRQGFSPGRGQPCAADARIQAYLDRTLAGTGQVPRLPLNTFALDQAGLARELSLPLNKDSYTSPLLKSYRLRNGVLHNPASDRRTTKGVFHVAEGGLPIPDDKLAVPKVAFARMLKLALNPPRELLRLPRQQDRDQRGGAGNERHRQRRARTDAPAQSSAQRVEIAVQAQRELLGVALVIVDALVLFVQADGLHDQVAHAQRHEVAVELIEATSDVQLKALTQGEIDAGFMLHAPGLMPGAATRLQRLSLATRSDLTIEAQISAPGATWIDRQLLAEEATLSGSGFGAEVREAMDCRVEHLASEGLARRQGQRV